MLTEQHAARGAVAYVTSAARAGLKLGQPKVYGP